MVSTRWDSNSVGKKQKREQEKTQPRRAMMAHFMEKLSQIRIGGFTEREDHQVIQVQMIQLKYSSERKEQIG